MRNWNQQLRFGFICWISFVSVFCQLHCYSKYHYHHTVRVILLSVVSVCVFVWMSVNTLYQESTLSWPSWFTRRFVIELQHILSMTVSSSLMLAIAGYDRPTSTRVVFHRPTHRLATGALEQFAGQDSPARQ